MLNNSTYTKFQTIGLWATRLILVIIFLYHGAPKAINWTLASEKFIKFGLPGFLGPITGIVEVVAAFLLLLGLFWQVSNWVLLFIIAGAIAIVQLPGFLADSSKVAGLERDLLILVGHLVLLAFPPRKTTPKQKTTD